MKRILLSLATLLAGVSAWAGVTDLPEITTDLANPVYYVIHNTRSATGKSIYFDETEGLRDNDPDVAGTSHKFYFTGTHDAMYIHNAATDKKLAGFGGQGAWTEAGVEWQVIVSPQGTGVAIGKKGADQSDLGSWLNEYNEGDTYTNWKADDEGSVFVLEKLADAEATLAAGMPEVGKTYLITAPLFLNKQRVFKGLVSEDNGSGGYNLKWNSVTLNNDANLWTVEEKNGLLAFKNKSTGLYVNGGALSEAFVRCSPKSLGEEQFNIISNGITMHANDHGNGKNATGTIVGWPGDIGSASAWQFIEAIDEAYLEAYFEDVAAPVAVGTEEPKYFAIQSGRGADKWYTYTTDGKIALEAFTGADTQLWCFKGTVYEGEAMVQLVPKAAPDKAMGYNNTSDGAGVVGIDMTYDVWKLVLVDKAHYRLKTYNGANLLSHNGGGSNKMGLYSSSETSDGGTQMYIYCAENVSQMIQDEITRAEALTAGTTCGYFTKSEGYDAAKVAAEAMTEANTNVEWRNAYNELKAAVDAFAVILPEAGFYRIKNSDGNGYLISGATDGGRVQFKSGTSSSKNSIFYFDGEKLLSYDNGLYIASDTYNRLVYTTTVGNAVKVQFEAAGVTGKLHIRFQKKNETAYNRYFHGLTTDAATSSDACGSDGGHTLHDFTIEKVESLPVAIADDTEKGYVTLYSPVQLSLGDKAARVEVYTAEVNDAKTAVTLTKHEGCVPANTGVILKYLAEIDTTGCVYLQIQETTVTGVASALTGTLADEYITPEAGATCYVLSKVAGEVGFYRAALNQSSGAAFLNNGFRAYLPVSGGGAARLLFDFGGTETGIESIEGNIPENAAIYDLSGRRVSVATKGIYIVNGKKVVVK